jgi:hypothetical protein
VVENGRGFGSRVDEVLVGFPFAGSGFESTSLVMNLKDLIVPHLFRVMCCLSCLLLASCGSVQLGGLGPMTRPTEVKGIELLEPWQFEVGFGGANRYPAGLYSPSAQNTEGTFYKCPTPVRTVEAARWMERDCDSGFYLRDDQVDGLHIWARNGEIVGRNPVSKMKTQPKVTYIR